MDAERHVAIDAVRGYAVLGILLMNIVGMGLPSNAYVNPAYYGGDDGANLAAWVLAFLFVDGKMRTLFTLLFGASLLRAASLPPSIWRMWPAAGRVNDGRTMFAPGACRA